MVANRDTGVKLASHVCMDRVKSERSGEMKARSMVAAATAAVVGLLYAQPSHAGLIGYYKLDGDSLDTSGKGNHATIQETNVAFAVGPAGNGSSTPGMAADFTGGYLDTGKTASQLGIEGAKPKAVSAWVY